jgi:hypothetical protein
MYLRGLVDGVLLVFRERTLLVMREMVPDRRVETLGHCMSEIVAPNDIVTMQSPLVNVAAVVKITACRSRSKPDIGRREMKTE